MLLSDDLVISVTPLLFLSYYKMLTMCNPKHSLHYLLPPRRTCDNLRSRGHSFDLPAYSSSTHKKSFILRTLYDFM